jgi:hypothetical protein
MTRNDEAMEAAVQAMMLAGAAVTIWMWTQGLRWMLAGPELREF